MSTSSPLSPIVRCLRSLDAKKLTDRQLLNQFAEGGDEDAFALLVRRHGAMVLAACRRVLRQAHDAEDAAQAAFIVLARKAGALRWNDSIAGWLHEVAVRVALDARKQHARRRTREQAMADVPERAEKAADRQELLDELDLELSALPEKLRAPLVLCYLEGYTRDEAAEKLGWTVSLVKNRLERGRDILRSRLARRGLTLASALSVLLLSRSADAALPIGFAATLTGLAMGTRTGSSAALALAARMVKAMALAKAKSWGWLLAALATLAAGLGVLAQHGFSAPEAPPAPQPPIRPVEIAAPPMAPKAPPTLLSLKHGDHVRSARYASDGKVLVTASMDGTFKMWNTATGAVLHKWDVEGQNTAVALSRDGKRVAGGNAFGELLVWNTSDGSPVFGRLTRKGNMYFVDFAPDGAKLVTANHNGTISLWDSDTGETEQHISAHVGRVWCARFSPDGKVIASCGEDSMVCLWDAHDGKALHEFHSRCNHAAYVAFSSDGGQLACGGAEDTNRTHSTAKGRDDVISIWDLATGTLRLSIRAPMTHGVCFSPDGKRLASAHRSGEVCIWNVATGACVHRWLAHQQAAFSVQYHPTVDRLLTSGADGQVLVWDLQNMP